MGKSKAPSKKAGGTVLGPRQVYEDDYTRGDAQDQAQSTGMAGYGSGVIVPKAKDIPGAPELPKVAESK